MAQLSLTAMPQVTVADAGGGTYRVQIPANTLPSQITVPAGSEGEPGQDEEPGQGGNVQKDVSWTFAPGEADGYRLQEVTEEN